MEGNHLSAEELFIQLICGRYPQMLSNVDPVSIAEALINAIDYHEDQIREAKDEVEFCEYMMAEEQAMIQGGIFDPWNEERMCFDLFRSEADSWLEKEQTAKSMKETCESMLINLLEEHPDLNVKL